MSRSFILLVIFPLGQYGSLLRAYIFVFCLLVFVLFVSFFLLQVRLIVTHCRKHCYSLSIVQAPSFVFVDEIDAIAGRHARQDPRRRATFEALIAQLDGE